MWAEYKMEVKWNQTQKRKVLDSEKLSSSKELEKYQGRKLTG
jgi:Leu/Phe-tRNA-protein transferase